MTIKSLLRDLALLLVLYCLQGQGHRVNNNPVIGILAQASPEVLRQYGDEYIDANYVKYLEMAGAKVVAVTGSQSEQAYQRIFDQINAILLPGGDVSLNMSQFSHMSRFFYQKAVEAFDQGDYFPVWGTCQGFEMLTYLTAGGYRLSFTDSENMTVPLDLTPDYRESRLFNQAPPDVIQYLTQEPVTSNFHSFSLLAQTYKETKSLNTFYRVISFNKDRNNKEYVSTMEAYKYPIYGVQWHPEKNIFMWKAAKALDHSAHAVEVTQFMANFFVEEARKNFHHFDTKEEEAMALIENDVMHYFPDTFQAYYYNLTKSHASPLLFSPEERHR